MPDRAQHASEVAGGDLIDRHPAERHGVGEGSSPVRLGAAVLPASAVGVDDGLDGLVEGRHAGVGPRTSGVAPAAGDPPVLERDLTGLGQRRVGHRPQADVPTLALDGAAPDPLLRSSGGDA